MKNVLCELKVPMTPARRMALQEACKRLDLSWPQIVWRVMCAAQDAATREINALIQAPHPPREQGDVAGGYPDCRQCWTARSEVCARCGMTVTDPPMYETPPAVQYVPRGDG